jgi:hypothetical protein
MLTQLPLMQARPAVQAAAAKEPWQQTWSRPPQGAEGAGLGLQPPTATDARHTATRHLTPRLLTR